MNRRQWVRYFLFPAAAGLAATALLHVSLTAATAPGKPAERVPLVVAAEGIAPYQVLDARHLRVVQVGPEAVPEGGSGDPERLVGRAVRFPLVPGEPILAAHLVAEGEGAGLAFRVPEGMRALSVRVTPEIAAGGFVQPGDRVDVLVVWPAGQGGGGPRAELLAADLRVLAVDRRLEADPEGKAADPEQYAHLTLAVPPGEAPRLALAEEEGRLRIALRRAGPSGGAAAAGRP